MGVVLSSFHSRFHGRYYVVKLKIGEHSYISDTEMQHLKRYSVGS